MNFMPTRAKIGKPQMVGMRFTLPYFPCPKMLLGFEGIQNYGFVMFFAHRAQVHQMSLNDMWRWPAIRHILMLGLLINRPLVLFDSWHGILARGASSICQLHGDLHIWWFLKLGFRLVGDNAFQSNKGQTWKTMDGGVAVGISIFPLPKHARGCG